RSGRSCGFSGPRPEATAGTAPRIRKGSIVSLSGVIRLAPATNAPESQTPMNPISSPGSRLDSSPATRAFGEPQWHTDGEILAMAYAADGTLWSVEDPGALRQWDRSGRMLGRSTLSDLETLWVFRPDAALIASGSDELIAWEVATRKQVASLPQPSWV